MTFNLSKCFSAWGSDSISNYPNLATALGMPKLEYPVYTGHMPFVMVHPMEPHHNQVLLVLEGFKAPYFLGCFDHHVFTRAIALGLSAMVQVEAFEPDYFARDEMAMGNWVDERYMIVRRHAGDVEYGARAFLV